MSRCKVPFSTTLHSKVGVALNEVNLRIIALQCKVMKDPPRFQNKFEMKLNFGHCIYIRILLVLNLANFSDETTLLIKTKLEADCTIIHKYSY